MKKTITRKVLTKILIIILLALTVLFIGSSFLISGIIENKSYDYSKTILNVYTDIISYSNTLYPDLDLTNNKILISAGNYICEYYDIDYAYIYIPHIVNNTITVLCFSQKNDDAKTDNNQNSYYVGKNISHTFSQEELDVVTGKQKFATIITNNKFGHMIGTLTKIHDNFGNVAIVGVDVSYNQLLIQYETMIGIIGSIMLLIIFLLCIFIVTILRKNVLRPAKVISNTMNNYIINKTRSNVKLGEMETNEFSMIAQAFNSMTNDIDDYVKNINALTREQERQNAELDIASNIQKGFLPSKSLNNLSYEIHAMMKPAQYIGGDLYDYFPLDDNRVFIAVADVSGKGISASLFMTETLIMIRQFAMLDLPPDKILQKTNNIISKKNTMVLFATTFVGVYDSKTRILTYSNAGHNLPYLVGNKLRLLEAESGSPLGLFEDECYPLSSIKLDVGDTLFVYTDGVTEAIDCNRKFYGEKRLENRLKEFKKIYSTDLVSFVNDALTEFSTGADQYDDITMLTLVAKDTKEFLLDVDLHEFIKIRDEIMKLPLSHKQKLNLCLATEEHFTNICSYAFDGNVPKTEKIKFTVEISNKITLCFEDGGKQFNPLEDVTPVDDFDIDEQIGGLGRFLALASTDDTKYIYENGKNILTIIKYLEDEKL